MKLKSLNLFTIVAWLLWPMGLLGIIILMFFTCSNKGINEERSTSVSISVETMQEPPQPKKEFQAVSIPQTLSSPEDRAAYLVTHYWDNFDFADTTYIHLPEITEQAFADYLSVLPHSDQQTAETSIKAMLSKSSANDNSGKMYAYFLSQYNTYLYDPNSPMRNEEFYIPVTEYILADTLSDETTKSRADFDLTMMQKNRKGTIATDISYLRDNGKRGSLYKLKKDYTLVYFFNPDCSACKETTYYLHTSPLINRLLENSTLDLLAVYPEEDISQWEEFTNKVSQLWINSRDALQTINNKQTYDLRAMPSLYLLDKDKKVLLKDADAQSVEHYLDEKINVL